MSKVVVTGIGVVSPLGVGIRTAWRELLAGRSGIVDLGPEFAELPSRIGGRVPHGTAEDQWDPARYIDKTNLRRMPLFAQYAVASSKMALADASFDPRSENELRRCGVAIGCGIGGIDVCYENAVAMHTGGYRKVSPMFVPSLLANMGAGHVSMVTGFRGPNHTVSTACTTGAHAIGDAANMIQLGMADVMLAGSTEACIHPLSVAGFARARSLSTQHNDNPAAASRPFDSKRDGFVIAEGAAVLVLESEEHAKARGAPHIYARVAGYGMSGDAFHVTAPHEDGRGAYDSMVMAIERSGVSPNEIEYVNAHATSTPLGDAIECRAIARALDREPSSIAVSSTKGATGHLLGAAGSLEAAFTVMAINDGIIPPSINVEEPGAGCDVDIVTSARQKPDLRHALTNSFGFGGTNASLVLSAV